MTRVLYAPEVGDAVVVAGTKFRIRTIAGRSAELARSGPGWRHLPIVAATDVRRLTWHKVAGAWRPRPAGQHV